jgi:ferritin-like metal-binding protein YciE
MELQNIHQLFVVFLKDLHSAEMQLTEALPKMARAANTPALREGFEKHLRETEMHIQRLEQVSQSLGESLEGQHCKGMEALIAEGEKLIAEGGEPSVIDAGLIAAAQKVEHYEIAAYGTVVALAELMDHDEEAALLDETLAEEKATDEKLTQIAEEEVNVEAKKTTGEME